MSSDLQAAEDREGQEDGRPRPGAAAAHGDALSLHRKALKYHKHHLAIAEHDMVRLPSQPADTDQRHRSLFHAGSESPDSDNELSSRFGDSETPWNKRESPNSAKFGEELSSRSSHKESTRGEVAALARMRCRHQEPTTRRP